MLWRPSMAIELLPFLNALNTTWYTQQKGFSENFRKWSFWKIFWFCPRFSLLSRINSNHKILHFKASLCKYIIHLMTKTRLLRPSLWKYDTSRWIKAKNSFENRKLTSEVSEVHPGLWFIVYRQNYAILQTHWH